MQEVTSATTCLLQVSPVLRAMLPNWVGLTVLDIGGGKFDANKQFAETFGVKLYIYDKFNRSVEENQQALACRPDVIICNNVLNVIDDGQALRNVIALCASYHVPCYFTVYEGNKSGIGGKTREDCWQRNWRAGKYVPILKKFFQEVTRKGNLIICR